MQFSGLSIQDNGVNNLIEIDEGSHFQNSHIVINGNNNSVRLGKTLAYVKLIVNLTGNDKVLEIKPSNNKICRLKWVSIRGDNQQFMIGKNFSCGGLEVQMNDGDENCFIGDDCLLSWGIKIRTSDGHSVIDLATNRAINLPLDVIIGNRVWVGEDVSFLKGSQVSPGSVVGSRAIVTKKFKQSNCVIAGFPAKIVKENIKWDNRMPYLFNSEAINNKATFVQCIKDNHYVQAYENWLRQAIFVPYKVVCSHLHKIENEKIFPCVLKKLANEKFDFIKPIRLYEHIYKLYRTNRAKYELYISELELIDELDYFTKAAFGMCEQLDPVFAKKLIKTNDKRLILRVFSLLPIHKNNINSFIKYKLMDSLEHPVLKLAYSNALSVKKYHRSTFKPVLKNKLKIAVCVSGQLRGYKKALASWDKFGFNDHDVDTYVCVWGDVGRKKLHPAHIHRLASPNVAQVFRDFISSYGLAKFKSKFNKFSEYLNSVNLAITSDIEKTYNTSNVLLVDDDKYTDFSNMEKMHMMIDKCWNMIKEPEIYDLIIRIRPDKSLSQFSFDLTNFNQDYFTNSIITDSAPSVRMNDIYMGDQFAIGNPQVMKIYSEIYSKYLKKNEPLFEMRGFEQLCAHSTLYANLLLNDINVHDSGNEIVFGELLETDVINIDTLECLINKDISIGSELYVNLLEAIKLDRELIQADK